VILGSVESYRKLYALCRMDIHNTRTHTSTRTDTHAPRIVACFDFSLAKRTLWLPLLPENGSRGRAGTGSSHTRARYSGISRAYVQRMCRRTDGTRVRVPIQLRRDVCLAYRCRTCTVRRSTSPPRACRTATALCFKRDTIHSARAE
jgi:hypothetical protein